MKLITRPSPFYPRHVILVEMLLWFWCLVSVQKNLGFEQWNSSNISELIYFKTSQWYDYIVDVHKPMLRVGALDKPLRSLKLFIGGIYALPVNTSLLTLKIKQFVGIYLWKSIKANDSSDRTSMYVAKTLILWNTTAMRYININWFFLWQWSTSLRWWWRGSAAWHCLTVWSGARQTASSSTTSLYRVQTGQDTPVRAPLGNKDRRKSNKITQNYDN